MTTLNTTTDKLHFTRLKEQKVRKAIEMNPWIIETCSKRRTETDLIDIDDFLYYQCDLEEIKIGDVCELILYIKQNY